MTFYITNNNNLRFETNNIADTSQSFNLPPRIPNDNNVRILSSFYIDTSNDVFMPREIGFVINKEMISYSPSIKFVHNSNSQMTITFDKIAFVQIFNTSNPVFIEYSINTHDKNIRLSVDSILYINYTYSTQLPLFSAAKGYTFTLLPQLGVYHTYLMINSGENILSYLYYNPLHDVSFNMSNVDFKIDTSGYTYNDNIITGYGQIATNVNSSLVTLNQSFSNVENDYISMYQILDQINTMFATLQDKSIDQEYYSSSIKERMINSSLILDTLDFDYLYNNVFDTTVILNSIYVSALNIDFTSIVNDIDVINNHILNAQENYTSMDIIANDLSNIVGNIINNISSITDDAQVISSSLQFNTSLISELESKSLTKSNKFTILLEEYDSLNNNDITNAFSLSNSISSLVENKTNDIYIELNNVDTTLVQYIDYLNTLPIIPISNYSLDTQSILQTNEDVQHMISNESDYLSTWSNDVYNLHNNLHVIDVSGISYLNDIQLNMTLQDIHNTSNMLSSINVTTLIPIEHKIDAHELNYNILNANYINVNESLNTLYTNVLNGEKHAVSLNTHISKSSNNITMSILMVISFVLRFLDN